MHRSGTSLAALVALCGFAFVGCSGGTAGREAITGTVTLKGQPIATGAIVMFEPLEKQDTAGNATVTGGSFAIPQANGLKPGKYLVRITAGDGTTAVNPVDAEHPPGPGGTNIISRDLVPADWNVNSKHEVTVAKGGPNKFDFEIP